MPLETSAPTFDKRGVRESGGAGISSGYLVGVGFGGICIMENFGETGDAANPAASTPVSNMCGAER